MTQEIARNVENMKQTLHEMEGHAKDMENQIAAFDQKAEEAEQMVKSALSRLVELKNAAALMRTLHGQTISIINEFRHGARRLEE